MIRYGFASRFSSIVLRSSSRSQFLVERLKSMNSSNLILNKNLCTFNLLNSECLNNQSNQVRTYSSEKEEQKPEDKSKRLNEEIQILEGKIKELKSVQKSKGSKTIEVVEGKYDKQETDDEEVIYRRAFDFPGFKLKNIKVTVVDQVLKIYAFQKGSKKDKETKEYIYENTTEEILPDEIDVNKMKAAFDSENGFLIVEAILPEDANLVEITDRTNEKNDKLVKLEKELEAKKKELSSIKI